METDKHPDPLLAAESPFDQVAPTEGAGYFSDALPAEPVAAEEVVAQGEIAEGLSETVVPEPDETDGAEQAPLEEGDAIQSLHAGEPALGAESLPSYGGEQVTFVDKVGSWLLGPKPQRPAVDLANEESLETVAARLYQADTNTSEHPVQ